MIKHSVLVLNVFALFVGIIRGIGYRDYNEGLYWLVLSLCVLVSYRVLKDMLK